MKASGTFGFDRRNLGRICGLYSEIRNGVNGLANGATTLGNDAINTTENTQNDTINNLDTSATTLGMGSQNYTATRTTTNTNLLGLSDTTWTWLILGIVGVAIVSLVWYYGAQYDHKNYSNESDLNVKFRTSRR